MNDYFPYQPSFLLKINRKWKKMGIVFFLLFFKFYTLFANDIFKEIKLDPINTYDEVPVEIIVNGYLRFEADVIITDTRAVYINVEELFKKLGIACVSEKNGDILSGFIENESIKYVIDFEAREITKNGNITKSINGIVKELGAIYIETGIMNEAFGLRMLFNFRSLSIKLEADFELPKVKEARLSKMRQNVSKLQSRNEVEIDTILGRNYHLFNGGALDWLISSNQEKGGKTNNRFSLGLGSELLYGEVKVGFNYYDQTKFDRRQLYYNWRWVDNDNNYIKQAQVGKIGAKSIAYLGAPIVGASINNSPNTVRTAKGTYTISDFTEANWTVELYINNNLVDYTEADASGFYEFKVPIVYGYTTLTLKFYGPLGEERVEEKTMNTPYTLMPAKVLEYNVSGGVLEDDDDSKFGRGEVNYGVNRSVTIGGGVEYLSSIEDNPLIPFANLSFQPFTRLIINMEYAQNVSLSGLLNYNFGRGAFLEVDYVKLVEGQQVTLDNMNEKRKVRLSLPFKVKKISANTKLSFNQYIYNTFNFNQLDALFSGRYKNYSANASIASNWVNEEEAFMTSTLVFSRRTRNGFILRPSIQYNITDSKMIRYRAEIEKRVSKMSFSASYERNTIYKTDNVFLSFRYDLPFARTGITSSFSNNIFNFSENAQGSMAFGADNGVITTGNNSSLGKGGILCYPFLDLNQNGIRDKNEQLVLLENVKVTGGKAVISEKDSIIRISDLNAFINYNVTFFDADLANISWKFKHKTYQILVDPNQYKKVEVPILVMAEINGMVYLNKKEALKGQGRIVIEIYDDKGRKVAETLSESDGYFSYLGLKPGNYTIKVDENQLKKLGYESTPLMHRVIVKTSADGDIIEDNNFEIKDKNDLINDKISIEDSIIIDATNKTEKTESNSLQAVEITSIEKPFTNKAAVFTTNNSAFKELLVTNKPYYSVQIGVFNEKVTPSQLFNLSPIYFEVLSNNKTRYIYGKFDSLNEAKKNRVQVVTLGIKDAFVVGYLNGKQVDLKQMED